MHDAVPGKRFGIEARSSLFYVFGHYYGNGGHLENSYRAGDSHRGANLPAR
jgi:hypothetical protein